MPARETVRGVQRAVDEVIAAAESVVPVRPSRRPHAGALNELDDLLARGSVDFGDTCFESLERALDDDFGDGAAPDQSGAASARPGAGSADVAARSHPRPGPVAGDRRVSPGTRHDRAAKPEEVSHRRSRSDLALEFARAIREIPGDSHVAPKPTARRSAAAGAKPAHRALLDRAIRSLHTLLAIVNAPLRLVPQSRRAYVNWLAISLAFWTPIVWMLALWISP